MEARTLMLEGAFELRLPRVARPHFLFSEHQVWGEKRSSDHHFKFFFFRKTFLSAQVRATLLSTYIGMYSAKVFYQNNHHKMENR